MGPHKLDRIPKNLLKDLERIVKLSSIRQSGKAS